MPSWIATSTIENRIPTSVGGKPDAIVEQIPERESEESLVSITDRLPSTVGSLSVQDCN